MLEDAGAQLVLTQKSLANSLPERRERVRLDADWAEIEREGGENPASQATPKTSPTSSTPPVPRANPKGVEIEHRNVVALLDWVRE